mmetsp:Transcript_33/g.80  ORF Transcript_33/g.80 Transcript_33/m.80 type:complete len:219 (-) Transcript_33:1005-1661(-)
MLLNPAHPTVQREFVDPLAPQVGRLDIEPSQTRRPEWALVRKLEQPSAHVRTEMIQMGMHRVRPTAKVDVVRKVEALLVTELPRDGQFVLHVAAQRVQLVVLLLGSRRVVIARVDIGLGDAEVEHWSMRLDPPWPEPRLQDGGHIHVRARWDIAHAPSPRPNRLNNLVHVLIDGPCCLSQCVERLIDGKAPVACPLDHLRVGLLKPLPLRRRSTDPHN